MAMTRTKKSRLGETKSRLRLDSAGIPRRVGLLAAMAFAGLAATTDVSAAPLGILVPAYFYPGPLWNSLNSAAARVPLTAIMNPNSGPGAARDANYVAAVNSLRAAGAKVIGYIHTSYAARPLAEVKTDIDRYLAWYALDGFFVDEVTNDDATGHLDYYVAVAQYIKGKGAKLSVTGNPGTNTSDQYLAQSAADALVLFENNAGYPTFAPSGWVTSHLARHFVHLVYDIPDSATMTHDIDLAVSRNAGWVYVTNDNGANPWDTLPSYWENEVSYVETHNQARPETRIGATLDPSGIPTLDVIGAPGIYEIQTSTDLWNWTPLATVAAPDGTAGFVDKRSVNLAGRFYRVAQ